MPEPRTAEERLQQFVEDHERRLRALEAQEKTTYTAPYVDDDDGYITWGGVQCQDLIPPLGDFGVCNGQFECGPTTAYPIDMQWVDESAGGTVTRIFGGVTGSRCFSLAGGTGVATARHDWYMPAYETRNYYIACHVKCKGGTDVFRLGVHCYDWDKTFIATVWAYNAAPGGAWIAINRRVGPGGDVALSAGTRYIRVVIQEPNVGETAYVDDVQFQQMKAAQSSTIKFASSRATGRSRRTPTPTTPCAGSTIATRSTCGTSTRTAASARPRRT